MRVFRIADEGVDLTGKESELFGQTDEGDVGLPQLVTVGEDQELPVAKLHGNLSGPKFPRKFRGYVPFGSITTMRCG